MSCGNISMNKAIINSLYYLVKIHPIICLWLRKSTRQTRTKSSTKMNHGNDENRTQNSLLPGAKHNGFGHTSLYETTETTPPLSGIRGF